MNAKMLRKARSRVAVVVVLLAVGLVATAGFAQKKSEGDAATRATMAQLLASFRTLVPLSVSAVDFERPEEQLKVRTALGSLAANAEVLRKHGDARTAEFDFLGRSLGDEATEALRRYEWGQYDSARFLVQEMTEYCIACHSRLPTDKSSPLAAKLVEDSTLAKLPPHERAEMQVATRRFDDALTSFEEAFASPDVPAAALLEPISEYLVTAIRVKQNPERAILGLEKLETRSDVWGRLRDDIGAWRSFLRKLKPRLRQKPTLALARRTVREAEQLLRYPADRQGLVHYVVASSILHRVIEQAKGKKNRSVAEAHFLLGLAEARLRQSYWVSHAEYYLETAIRMAPATKVAQAAFLVLEEETILAHGGDSGVRIPDEVAGRLMELRRLAGAR
jgi:hypothetical protein